MDRKHRSFCANYGKDQDEVWSTLRIRRIILYRKEETRTKEEFISFKVERADDTVHRISSADFYLMNPYDVMNLFWIWQEHDAKIGEKVMFKDTRDVLRGFLKSYLSELGRMDNEIGRFAGISPYALNKFVPIFCEGCEDGTILKTTAFGMIMGSTVSQGQVRKIFMCIDELSRYSNSDLKKLIEGLEKYQGNDETVRADVLRKINWLLAIRSELPRLRFVFV